MACHSGGDVTAEVHPRRWWALGVLSLVLLVVGLDLTVLNVAVPLVATDLDASTGELQWIVNAYTVVLATLLLPAGQLGDRFGRKKLLLGGLAFFGFASLVCASATSPELLIAGRALLGVGAAFLNTLGLAVLVAIFPPEERAKAIGIQSVAISAGIPLGPIVGGLLVEHFWWGSVFLINVPLVVIAFVGLAILVPESTASRPPRIDVLGFVLAVTGLCALSYGLIDAGETSWFAPVALLAMGVGLVALAGFVLRQRRVAEPLADLTLFGDRNYTLGSVLSAFVQFSVFGIMFVLPQFFQAVLGASELETGLWLLPLVVAMIVGVQVGAPLRPRIGSRGVIMAGFVALAVGLVLGAMNGADSGFGYAVGWTVLIGFGFGMSMPPAIDITLEAIPTEKSGGGSALLQAQRQVGAVLGVAVMGSVLATNYRGSLDTFQLPPEAAGSASYSGASGIAVAEQLGLPQFADAVRASFTAGMSAALWTCAAVTVVCVLVAAAVRPAVADRSTGAEGGA
ncbi:MFS transporter [Pseudonocardia sp. MH-G8]|nr:MFS transporter [Pseudonocardia sp. MH-G8]